MTSSGRQDDDVAGLRDQAQPIAAATHVAHALTTPCPGNFPIPDGGGCLSTADWSIPRVKENTFKSLRQMFELLAKKWGLVPRLLAHVANPTADSLLRDSEIQCVRQELVDFLCSQGYHCDAEVSPDQPFLLNAWEALARITGDIDSALPSLLKDGVPIGILTPIAPSGVWDPIEVEHDMGQTLLIHREPWGSALNAPNLPGL